MRHISASDKGKTLEIKMPSKKTYTVSIKNPIIPDVSTDISQDRTKIDSKYKLSIINKGSIVFNGPSGHIHFSSNYESASNGSDVIGSGKSSYVSFSGISLNGGQGEVTETAIYNIYTTTTRTTYLPPVSQTINFGEILTIGLQSEVKTEQSTHQENDVNVIGYTDLSIVSYRYNVSGTAYSYNIGCYPQGITKNNATFDRIIKYELSGNNAVLNADNITLTVTSNRFDTNGITSSYPDTLIYDLKTSDISHD